MIETIIVRLADIVTGLLWAALGVAVVWIVVRWALTPDYVTLVAPGSVRGSFTGIGR